MNNETREVLTKARKLIEIGWTKHKTATDAWGRRCNTMDKKATCFCILGAISRAAWDLQTGWETAYGELVKIEPLPSVFNDNARSKHEVLALFDRALAE